MVTISSAAPASAPARMLHSPAVNHRGGARRRHGASGVIAIGQQDQHLLALLGGIQHPYAQPDRVANGRVGARHAHGSPLQQQAQRSVVARERRLRIGARAEHDQTQPVIGSAPV
ncbi:hypothetical protein G6F62_015010 [Rhizopus arrhizus]|nr:hypothetical protein G6F62_015010 [Rhizopus arrhizus]